MHLQGKRGLSLIELVVTVGILGLLSVISTSMYKQYRVGAKEATLKKDLQNLHKSWQAFGVYNNFCVDESGTKASITLVGMASILLRNTYGENSSNRPNFIGFGSENGSCTNSTNPPVTGTFEKNKESPHTSIGIGAQYGSSPSVDKDDHCRLTPDSYRMGVYGYIGATKNVDGNDITHRGFMITNNGILSESKGQNHEDTPRIISIGKDNDIGKISTDPPTPNVDYTCSDGSTITLSGDGDGFCPPDGNYTSAC